MSSGNDSGLAKSILRTLIYADMFDHPLSLAELHHDLIGRSAEMAEIEECLRSDPLLAQRVERSNGVVHLRGRQEIVRLRKERQAATDELLQENLKLLRRLALIPNLRMLAISGGASHGSTYDDIDLFAVTKARRCWLAFGLMILVSRLHGKRETICINYLVDETSLQLGNGNKFHSAHQLLHLRPLSDQDCHAPLLANNQWTGKIFPNATGARCEALRRTAPWRRSLKRGLEVGLWPMWAAGEKLSRLLLRERVGKKAASSPDANVLLGDGVIKLHLKDHGRPIMRKYVDRLKHENLWDSEMESLVS